MNLEINYKPRPYQEWFHGCDKRWMVNVWHRWAGKTTSWLAELLRKALQKKGVYEFISPTYRQSKRNAWGILKNLLIKFPKKAVSYNEADLKCTLPNWSIIYLLWADNPDSLRWLDYHWVVYDEYSQQPSNIHSEIVRPRLSITNWWALWIWTPKWLNSFYELYTQAENDDDWYSELLTVYDTNIIDENEIKQAKKDMTIEEFEQEMLCSFNAALKGAYYSSRMWELRREWRIKNWIYDPILPVYTFWDLWLRDYTSIVFVQMSGWEVRIIDYIEDHNKWLEYYADKIQSKPYRYEMHYFPHDVKQREMSTWQTRLETMERLFWSDKCDVVKSISLADGINAVRMMLPNCWFQERSTWPLRNALSNYQQEWDDHKGIFKDRPLHNWASHAADAFRYLAVTYKDLSEWMERGEWNFVVDYSQFV